MYNPEISRYDKNHKNGFRQQGSLLSSINKGLALSQEDRGLIPNKSLLDKKMSSYNYSHHKVGPGSYNSLIGTIGGKFILKAN